MYQRTTHHRSDGGTRRRQQGSVQLGELNALASWTDGQILTLCFPLGAINKTQLRQIEHLRSTCDPVEVILDGDEQTGGNRIVGYERSSEMVTFHVARG